MLSAVVIPEPATGLVYADPANVLVAVVRLADVTGLTDALAVTVLSAVVMSPDTVAPLAAAPPTYSPRGFVPNGNAPRITQATLANSRTALRLATIAQSLLPGGPLLRQIWLYRAALYR